MQRSRSEKLSLKRQSQGVTLLELMIVVVIIGLLSIIAVPSYRQYSIRAHRTEAKTALIRLATNQERFYLQNVISGLFANPGGKQKRSQQSHRDRPLPGIPRVDRQ